MWQTLLLKCLSMFTFSQFLLSPILPDAIVICICTIHAQYSYYVHIMHTMHSYYACTVFILHHITSHVHHITSHLHARVQYAIRASPFPGCLIRGLCPFHPSTGNRPLCWLFSFNVLYSMLPLNVAWGRIQRPVAPLQANSRRILTYRGYF